MITTKLQPPKELQPWQAETLTRSETYQRMWPDDKMQNAFGKLNPSTSERTAYFFDLWMIRRQWELRTNAPHIAKKICTQLGLQEPWDYQLRNNSVMRFDNAQFLGMYKLAEEQ